MKDTVHNLKNKIVMNLANKELLLQLQYLLRV